MTTQARRWPLSRTRRALALTLRGRSDYTRFIILARSRVGSNLLRGLLNAHPHIVAFGEIFREAGGLDWDHIGSFQSGAMQALVREDPVRFLETKMFGRYPHSVRAVGFKLFYYHARQGAEASVWPYLLQRNDLKVIHLKRKNLLQTHASRRLAALTDQWVDTSGAPNREVVVTLDYEEMVKDFVQTRAWEEECDRYFANHAILQVQYEQLASDDASQSQAIQAFLGVAPRAVKPSTFRQARQPLSQTVANYGELKKRFTGTPWEEFFTE